MNITLYNNKAEKNRVNKGAYLSRIITMTGTLRESCSVTSPSILIELDAGSLQQSILKKVFVVDDDSVYATTNGSTKLIYDLIAEILTANYVYIKEFDRYYFVTDIISEGRNLWRLNMSVDVLMSFMGEIKSLTALVSRNANTYDLMVQDSITNFEYDKVISFSVPTMLSAVTTFTTTPTSSDNTALIAYLTDNSVKYSSTTPALNDLPAINLYSSATSISTQYMTGTTGILYDLAKAVYKNDTLLSYIKNVMVYPYSITSISDASINSIKIGSTSYTLTDTFKYPQYSPERVLIAHFTMNAASSFMDYSPYTLYEFYIPYLGYVSLSGEAILGKELKVFYLVNYEDGTSTAYVYNVTDSKVIYQGECVLGLRVALSSTNALEIKNQKTALALNTGINLIGAALTVAGGVATENPLTVAGGVMKGASTIGSAITTYNQLYDQGSVGVTSASGGLSNSQSFYIKITKSKPLEYDSSFFSLKGRPLNQFMTLSDLTGFTVVSDVHLEGFSTANDTELSQIDSLLKDGIIL